MFSLKKRRLRVDFIAVCNFILKSRKGGAHLLTGERTQGNDLKRCHGKFRLDIRKKFFIEWVVRQCNKLPREVVVAPNLLVCKKHLDQSLRYLV